MDTPIDTCYAFKVCLLSCKHHTKRADIGCSIIWWRQASEYSHTCYIHFSADLFSPCSIVQHFVRANVCVFHRSCIAHKSLAKGGKHMVISSPRQPNWPALSNWDKTEKTKVYLTFRWSSCKAWALLTIFGPGKIWVVSVQPFILPILPQDAVLISGFVKS